MPIMSLNQRRERFIDNGLLYSTFDTQATKKVPFVLILQQHNHEIV